MSDKSDSQLKAEWAAKLRLLIGRTITGVRFMVPEERDQAAFAHSPVILTLDDDTLLYPLADDEGNDAGALAIQAGTKTVGIPEGAPAI